MERGRPIIDLRPLRGAGGRVRRLRVVVAQSLRALSADPEPRGRAALQGPAQLPPLEWTAQPHAADAAVTQRAPTLPLLREMLSQVLPRLLARLRPLFEAAPRRTADERPCTCAAAAQRPVDAVTVPAFCSMAASRYCETCTQDAASAGLPASLPVPCLQINCNNNNNNDDDNNEC